MADLQPWIEQEKAKHVRRIVNIAKRGFECIEKVWDENERSARSGRKYFFGFKGRRVVLLQGLRKRG